MRSEAGGAGPDTQRPLGTQLPRHFDSRTAGKRTVSAFSERRSMLTVVIVMGMPCRRCSVTRVVMANANVTSAVSPAAMRARRR